MPAAVQVQQVSKTFGVTRALIDVSMTVERGSSVALLGRNGAGKSTLVSIITGLQSPDTGRVSFGAGRNSDTGGVGCVYQKSTLVGGLTAAENIALQQFPRSRSGLIDWRKVRRLGRERLAQWGCEQISDRAVEDLEPVERKIVEICRVLSQDPDVLLLDEPTAGLDYGGAQRLFQRIEESRRRGVSIIYVSHHLEEVFEVCDRTTILRDGQVVLDQSLDGLAVGDLVRAMVGDVERAESAERPPAVLAKEPLLLVDSLTLNNRFEDVTMDVRPGECVGIAGLDGAGHVQVAETLCGLETPDGGRISIAGVPVKTGDVRRSIAAGIGFVPEDRHIGGFVPGLSVAENATLPVMSKIVNPMRLIRARSRDRIYNELAADWSIKAWGTAQPVEQLSGGNQQKVVLARAVSSDPSVLVLMNPTAGVDVAAKESIYETVKVMASRGKAIVIISSDDADFSLCHRVIVMYRGKVHNELRAPFSDEELATTIQGN